MRRVGRKIAAAVKRPDIPWEFAVFVNPTPNAFALPGGKVIVTTGLLALVGRNAELAAVLGHEIGHVMARHSSEQGSQRVVAALGGSVLDAALRSAGGVTAGSRQLLLGAYGAGAEIGVLLPYSRTHESEADRLGLILHGWRRLRSQRRRYLLAQNGRAFKTKRSRQNATLP